MQTVDENSNISVELLKIARTIRGNTAIAHQLPEGNSYHTISFEELDSRSTRLASGLYTYGLGRGKKTLLMIKPSVDFIVTTFALFKAGGIPVFIDPGMGADNLASCAKQAEPSGFIGIPKAHIARKLFGSKFPKFEKMVTIGKRYLWGGTTDEELISGGDRAFPPVKMTEDETAAIIFTTGSTGTPKGVRYTHKMFRQQLEIIKTDYGAKVGDVDLACFPLFALFSVSLGMKAVIPDMDASKPANVNPARIVSAVQEQQVTFSFGSPAIWGKVAAHCIDKKIKLPSIRKILMAGAPVQKEIHEQLLHHVLSISAETHTPYGATEALPISDMTGSKVLRETAKKTAAGEGICVGRPLSTADIKIIGITDGVITNWDAAHILPPATIGEIVVKSNVASTEYNSLPEQTELAKIKDGDGFWHRMGDVGYIDWAGQIWFCGRMKHRVSTKNGAMYTIPCEAIFNNHKEVKRAALVGIGNAKCQTAVIVIERVTGSHISNGQLTDELFALAAKSHLTSSIKHILYHPDFPTDIRHNAKIFREKLAEWAEKNLRNVIKNSSKGS